jgi:deoxyribodipyrimidine photolyase
MPEADAAAAGYRQGRDYPAPIVDRRETRARALAAYTVALDARRRAR